MATNVKTTRVLLAAESLTAGHGGICRVARLVNRVLAEQCRCDGVVAQALVLNGAAAPETDGLPIATARASRLRFCLQVHRAALDHSHFIYDFLGMARAHCRLPGLKRRCLSYIHGIEVWEDAATHYVRTARKVDFLLSNSAYTRQRAERMHGGFARATVCWLATECDERPAPARFAAGPPTVLILGRMDQARYKGHDELIACWPQVVSAIPDARLLVVGAGPEFEAVKKAAAQSSVARHIEFRGFIGDAGMESVWAETTLFAMPSRGEGFGLVYIEAMRHAIPVIASIHDAAPEINLDGQTGYNVDLQRPPQLPERIICLLKDRDHAARLGANGQRRWAEHFTYSAFRSRFLPVLNEFLGEGP